MFRFFALLIFFLLLALPVYAQQKVHDFFKTPWGASKEHIAKDYGAISDTNGNLVLLIQNKRTIVFTFLFKKDKLVRIEMFFESLASSATGTAEFCDTVAMNMSQLHGQPEVSIKPNIGPILYWANKNTQVQLFCKYENPGYAAMIWEPRKQSKTPKGIEL
jgi:hypothetical protein